MHGRRQDHDRGAAQRPDRSAGMDRDRTGVGTGDSRAEGMSAIRINRQKSKHSADRGGVLAYKRKPGNHMIAGFPLAGDEGFEPPQTESESGVLPLHKSPKWPLAEAHDYYNDFSQKVKTNFFFFAEIKTGRYGPLMVKE